MKSIFHLKLAGIYEHIKAIEELADFYAKKDSEKAIPLYMFLSKKTQNPNKYAGNIGSAYYNLRDYNNAYNHLIKATNAEAYYNLGKIYDFGLGRMKDLEEAEKCYKKAMDLGHKGAYANYQKVSARSESIAQKNRSNSSYNSSSNYSSYSSSSSSSTSDSWCFLTTATCKALQQGDDCKELIAFKKYRDEWLIMQSDGASLIKEYYKIAPDIVAHIDQDPEADMIYRYMWERYIKVGYEYLKKKDYIRAKEIYIQMVLELMQKYKITR